MVNIFVLDEDLTLSAQYTYDAHIIKGILEGVQIFFSVRRLLHFAEFSDCYKMYKVKFAYHGCVKWAMYSYSNYMFLVSFIKCLNYEFKYRYSGDNHASYNHMVSAMQYDNSSIIDNFNNAGFTDIYQSMPFIYQHVNYVYAYRMYYFFHKRLYLPYISWRKRKIPYWYCGKYFYENGIYVT